MQRYVILRRVLFRLLLHVCVLRIEAPLRHDPGSSYPDHGVRHCGLLHGRLPGTSIACLRHGRPLLCSDRLSPQLSIISLLIILILGNESIAIYFLGFVGCQ